LFKGNELLGLLFLRHGIDLRDLAQQLLVSVLDGRLAEAVKRHFVKAVSH